MITFLLALAALIAGYLIYGKVVERASARMNGQRLLKRWRMAWIL